MAPMDLALRHGQARHVHAQSAAKRHVQDLHTATRREQGLVCLQRRADELELEGVALVAEQALVIRLLLTPQGGVHILPAGNRHAIGHLNITRDDILVLGERHDERQAARGENRVEKHRGPRLLGGQALRHLQARLGLLQTRCNENYRSIICCGHRSNAP